MGSRRQTAFSKTKLLDLATGDYGARGGRTSKAARGPDRNKINIIDKVMVSVFLAEGYLNNMPEPLAVRLNTAEMPKRNEMFDAEIKRWRLSQSAVVHGLIDAFLAFIEEHERPPTFPIKIVPIEQAQQASDKGAGKEGSEKKRSGK
jgi:hypothetical protein